MDDVVKLKSEERVLFIINDNAIEKMDRFQKYGFLIWNTCQKEIEELKVRYPDMSYYDDWKPSKAGPYSKKLEEDIKKLVSQKIISERGTGDYRLYVLTLDGQARWRYVLYTRTETMMRINDKIRYLQGKTDLDVSRQFYEKYPDYFTESWD